MIGIRRKAIAAVFPLLQQALSGPKPMCGELLGLRSHLLPVCEFDYLDEKAVVPEGVVVFLQPILDRIDRISVAVQVQTLSTMDLQLGPDFFARVVVQNNMNTLPSGKHLPLLVTCYQM